MAYRINSDRVLTGDALFIRGCGRTDLQGGDAGILFDSVTQRLFTLLEETLVYPAHDYRGCTASTIGEERRWNPRFSKDSGHGANCLRHRASFIELVTNLELPKPQKMMEAIPANEHCGNLAFLKC